MKLLIVTQKVDKADPILGFFHRWIEEFALHCESVIVIGQMVGEHQLPSNVTVLSLEKEKNASKLRQIRAFKKHIRSQKNQYEAVLVHMTPIWVVFGGFFWKRQKKRMYLWYEARGKRWPLRFALRKVRKVFSASKHGMPIDTPKSVVVGHGIDTDAFFEASGVHNPHSIISVGRITKAKHPELLLRAFSHLPEGYSFHLVGHAITSDDQALQRQLNELIQSLKLADRVHVSSISQKELIPQLQGAVLFLHASETPLDKAVLEAMACGCLVVSCADAVVPILPASLRATRESLGETAASALLLPPQEQQRLRGELRSFVEMHHSLKSLIPRLLSEMSAVA